MYHCQLRGFGVLVKAGYFLWIKGNNPAVPMLRWNILLGAHNAVLADKGWSVAVRLEVCKLLKRKMIELGPLKPFPPDKSSTAK